MLRTFHSSEASLARAVANELRLRGVRFPAVFPYNRFNDEHSTWWLAMKGSPAYAVTKICCTRTADKKLAIGLVMEKGYEYPGHKPSSELMKKNWDWHLHPQKMGEHRFTELLEALAPHAPQVLLDVVLPGAGRVDGAAFQASPWALLSNKSGPPEGQALRSATGLPALLKALQAHPQRTFCWFDLYFLLPLSSTQPGDDPAALDELLVDTLLPLIRWAWPGLVSSESL